MPDYNLNWITGPVLYKGDKGISNATRPIKGGGLAEAVALSSSSLPWSIDRLVWMPDSPLKSQRKHPILVSAAHQTGLLIQAMTNELISREEIETIQLTVL